jgi:hypothetical protein
MMARISTFYQIAKINVLFFEIIQLINHIKSKLLPAMKNFDWTTDEKLSL